MKISISKDSLLTSSEAVNSEEQSVEEDEESAYDYYDYKSGGLPPSLPNLE